MWHELDTYSGCEMQVFFNGGAETHKSHTAPMTCLTHYPATSQHYRFDKTLTLRIRRAKVAQPNDCVRMVLPDIMPSSCCPNVCAPVVLPGPNGQHRPIDKVVKLHLGISSHLPCR